MYKTQIEKFVIGDNIGTSVMIEKDKDGTHYALLRISLFGKDSFAICVLGDGYALEAVGECATEAEALFAVIVREGVSPVHLFDVVTDIRRERDQS